ncbi:unnamed protein product [marine sediment metagenome]|uniref:Uncharacterized protein n=1 Tax=marine sediment metagenome TaxID=412755 RepID=X1FRJ7_9ZZZZ
MKKPYEYKEIIVICHRDDIKDTVFPLLVQSFLSKTKEEILEKNMDNILDYLTKNKIPTE